MRDVEQHLAPFGHPTADFFVEGREHAVHLEADGACAGLALTLAGCRLAEIGEIFFADSLQRQMPVELAGAAGIDVDLEVHLRLAVQTLQVALELTLVGADGFAKSLVVLEDSSKTEGKDGGVLEAVSDNPGVIDAGFLIQSFGRGVFADDDS
jgi:hypothetical protein